MIAVLTLWLRQVLKLDIRQPVTCQTSGVKCVCVYVGEREGERGGGGGGADRQTDRQTGRQRDREIDTLRER